MHRKIIPIFIVLALLWSCPGQSETAADLLSKADASLNGKDIHELQKTIEDLTKSIKQQPDNDAAYNIRGIIYFTLGQNQLAIDDFSKAIQLNPTNADYFNSRGMVYNKLGQYQQAIKDFDEAILFDPNVGTFYNNRGEVHLKHSDKNIGCLDAEKACKLNSCDLLKWAKKKKICK